MVAGRALLGDPDGILPQTHRKPGLSPPHTATSSAEGDPTHSASRRTREREWPRVAPSQAAWDSWGRTPSSGP